MLISHASRCQPMPPPSRLPWSHQRAPSVRPRPPNSALLNSPVRIGSRGMNRCSCLSGKACPSCTLLGNWACAEQRRRSTRPPRSFRSGQHRKHHQGGSTCIVSISSNGGQRAAQMRANSGANSRHVSMQVRIVRSHAGRRANARRPSARMMMPQIYRRLLHHGSSSGSSCARQPHAIAEMPQSWHGSNSIRPSSTPTNERRSSKPWFDCVNQPRLTTG
jgi:hypothetical protein